MIRGYFYLRSNYIRIIYVSLATRYIVALLLLLILFSSLVCKISRSHQPGLIQTMLFNLSVAGVLATGLALLSSIAAVEANGHTYNGPKSTSEFRHNHPYHQPPTNHRPKVFIRASKNATDDISVEFLKGLKKANHGGTLVLPKGQTFIIGKKLDLTFLNNVQVNLEGTIKVSS